MNIVLLEIGNTAVHVEVLNGGQAVYASSLEHEALKGKEEKFVEGLASFQIFKAVVSSVAPKKGEKILSILRKKNFDVAEISDESISPYVPVHVRDGVEVGIDLLLDVLGVEEKDAIIVDLGTCNKAILKKDGAFEGVAISPGFEASLKATIEETELMKGVMDLPLPKAPIGKDTPSALSSGILLGSIYGLLALTDSLDPNRTLPRYLCGGLANPFSSYFPGYKVVPSLGLFGLRLLASKIA